MSEEKVLTLRGKKAVWAPGGGPIDPKRLPEGYPYKAGVTIEWDGNTEGLENIGPYCKVSDAILDDDTLKNGVITMCADGSYTEQVISTMWTQLVSAGLVTENYVVLGQACVITRADNVAVSTFGEMVFPKAGVYFMKQETAYVSKFLSETIHTMAAEFVPANNYVVKITFDPNNLTITDADKTGNDILAALIAGNQVVLHNMRTVGVSVFPDYVFRYTGMIGSNMCFVCICSSDASSDTYLYRAFLNGSNYKWTVTKSTLSVS